MRILLDEWKTVSAANAALGNRWFRRLVIVVEMGESLAICDATQYRKSVLLFKKFSFCLSYA